MRTSPAIAFRDALCARDFAAAGALIGADAVMRGLLPPRTIEANGRDEILGWLTKWFAAGDGFEVLGRDDETTAGRTRVTYRFRFDGHPVSGEPGQFDIEQTAFCDTADGVVTRIDLLCSGFRPALTSCAV
jgi:hypothetical protein